MADDQAQSQAAGSATGFTVPDDVRAQHPELIDLIEKSESMKDAERQYWVGILPVMTPEQVEQLRSILQNEREQLAAIDAKYGKQVEEIAAAERPLEEIGAERQKRTSQRLSREQQAEAEEGQSEEEVLRQITDM